MCVGVDEVEEELRISCCAAIWLCFAARLCLSSSGSWELGILMILPAKCNLPFKMPAQSSCTWSV